MLKIYKVALLALGLIGTSSTAFAEELPFTISPEAGSTVTGLKDFTLTYSEGSEITLDTSKAPYLSLEGVKKTNAKPAGLSTEGNIVHVNFPWESTIPGEWALTLPEGFISINGAQQEEYNIPYTLKGITVVYSPDDYYVEEMAEIVLTFDGAETVEVTDESAIELSVGVNTIDFTVHTDANRLIINPSETTTPGDWYLRIPANTLSLDGAPYSTNISHYWGIERPPLVYTAEPEDHSTIPSLEKVTLTFADAENVSWAPETETDDYYWPLFYDEGEDEVSFGNFSSEGNSITFSRNTPYVIDGTYEIYVWGDSYIIDGAYGSDLVITYTVDQASGINTIQVEEVKSGTEYNISGIKVENARGIVISNGKKIIR